MPDLKPADYPSHLDLLAGAATALITVAGAIDLPGMRRVCAEMEALAPVMEPTAYMRGGMTRLRDQAAFLRAVEAFVTEMNKLDRRTPEETAHA